jgi:lysophospholipid acyltransferase (LPLAT)-like uncharacterized protein
MWRRLRRSAFFQEAVGFLLAAYFGLVRRTNRFAIDPEDMDARLRALTPMIIAMWHGQHFVAHFARPGGIKLAALISRHGDAALNAAVARRLGALAIRGSGGRPSDMHRKGGVGALREMLRILKGDVILGLTADVPKVPRVAGLGIVTLARLSGRPICPIAVVTSRSIPVRSWDKASFPLPFGRGIMLLGEPIAVSSDADAADLEAARQKVEDGLDALHARAYALVGANDPGAKAPHRVAPVHEPARTIPS